MESTNKTPYTESGFTGQKLYRFANGYGASVIPDPHDSDLLELAVIRWTGNHDFEFVYNSRICSGAVLGGRLEGDVEVILDQIRVLPPFVEHPVTTLDGDWLAATATRVDQLQEKCRRRGVASLADIEDLRNTVHRAIAIAQRLLAEKADAAPERMTSNDFMRKVLDCFPAAEVDQDNDGQLVVHTGYVQRSKGHVERMPD